MVTNTKRKRPRTTIDLTSPDKPDDVTQFATDDESDPDPPTPPDARAWSTKYSDPSAQKHPATSAQKRAQIHQWLVRALDASGPALLLLAGPPGSGKTSAIRSVARQLNCAISTWTAPEPATRAVSRSLLDDFDVFFLSARYPALSHPSDRRLLLVDDLPVTVADPLPKRQMLQRALIRAACFAPHPTVVVLSDADKAIARAVRLLLGVELVQSPRVASIRVPAVTHIAMRRIIQAVLADQRLALSSTQLHAVVASCQGDVRAALNGLQFAACTREVQSGVANWQKRARNGRRRLATRRVRISPVDDVRLDATLGTYHAVSKILNNKRTDLGESKYNAEEILDDARADPASFLAFLHQNYPAFFGDTDDVVAALACLSEADCLLPWRQDDTARLALFDCAASVATRAFLYYNQNPIRCGWRPIRGPESFQIAKEGQEYVHSVRQRFAHIMAPQVFVHSSTCESLPFAELISEARQSNCAIRRRNVSFANGSSISDAADIAMIEMENEQLTTAASQVHTAEKDAHAAVDAQMEQADEDIEEWPDDF